jgi:chromate transporter
VQQADDQDAASAGGGGPSAARGGVAEVFLVALGLGLTSFGGPIAHLGYFERTYVQRRRWLTAQDYAGLVALCQLVPGPASSQVGFLIGLRRAGWGGAFAAWLGFMLPSALIMFAFAYLAPRLAGPTMAAVLHGLKLVAVVVVAQAVWSMAGKLCPDLPRRVIAVAAATALLIFGGALTQIAVLVVAGIAGTWVCRNIDGHPAPPRLPIGRRTGVAAICAFLILLVALPLAAAHAGRRSLLAEAALFYRTGALVFGGGHVVLPLLRDAFVPSGWLSDNAFLSGYGAAQAVPGPLFTFAAYLGATIAPATAGTAGAVLWSAVGLISIFLPGMLVALAGAPLWDWLGRSRTAQGALAGVNAAVVGVLAAALYTPVWTGAVHGVWDIAVAGAGLVLLMKLRVAPVIVAALCVLATIGMRLAGVG